MASASTALLPPLVSLVGAFCVGAFCVGACSVVCSVVTVCSTASAPAAGGVVVVARPVDGALPAAGVPAVDLVPLLVVTLSFSRVRRVRCHTTPGEQQISPDAGVMARQALG